MLCFVSKFLAWVNVWMDGGTLTSLRIQEEQDREGRAPFWESEAACVLCSTMSKAQH